MTANLQPRPVLRTLFRSVRKSSNSEDRNPRNLIIMRPNLRRERRQELPLRLDVEDRPLDERSENLQELYGIHERIDRSGLQELTLRDPEIRVDLLKS